MIEPIRSFICVRRKGARMTPGECARLRSLPRQLAAHGQPGVEYMPLTCEYCRDWPRFMAAAGEQPKAAGKITEAPLKACPAQAPEPSPASAMCLECGEREAVARDLCRRCYNRLYYFGQLDRRYPRRR